MVVFLLLIGAGGYFGLMAYHDITKILRGGGHSANLSGLNLAALQHEGDARINVLVVGWDPPVDGDQTTDTIMIASIDPVNNTGSLISIPRDLWVKLPGCQLFSEQKINAAYECAAGLNGLQDTNPRAGMAYLSKIVKAVTGVNINYVAVVDNQAFKTSVDAVGGVTIDIQGTDPRGVLDRNFDWRCDYKCFLVKYPNGPVHLDGTQALYLAQARGDAVAPQYTGYGFANGDFERQQNQRKIVIGLAQSAKSISFLANPVKVLDFLNGLGTNVVTNISQSDALKLIPIVEKIPFSKITSVDIPTSGSNAILTTGGYDGLSVVEPTAGIFSYSQLQEFVRSNLIDPYIIKEHPTIALYNGTNVAGLAAQEAAVLKSYGYNVVSVATAPTQDYSQTVFYDTTGGALPVTKQYLQNRFGVKAQESGLPTAFMTTSTTLASKGRPAATTTKPVAQYVIVLGQNFANG